MPASGIQSSLQKAVLNILTGISLTYFSFTNIKSCNQESEKYWVIKANAMFHKYVWTIKHGI